MNLPNPYEVFLLAVSAGAGWALGASLVQSAANQVNLYLIGRTTKRQADAALARINQGVAKIQEAAAAARTTAPEQPAAIDQARDVFPVLGEPGRS